MLLSFSSSLGDIIRRKYSYSVFWFEKIYLFRINIKNHVKRVWCPVTLFRNGCIVVNYHDTMTLLVFSP